MIRTFTCAAILSAGLSGPAFSADQDGRYAVEGPGRLNCAAFTELDRGSAQMRDAALWLSGYVTAHNRLVTDTFDLTPWQTAGTLVGLIGQYCQANPDAIVEHAAQELISYLARTRLEAEAPTISQKSGDQITVVYSVVVERALRVMVKAGIVAGDGEDGVAEAVRIYQKQEGLPVTGLLDQPTLGRLFW